LTSTNGRTKLWLVGKGEQTRQAIVAQALDLASSGGLESLSIGELAKAVGMSKSGLFAHFKSKEQLQLDVLEAAVARFIDKVVTPALREPRGEPRVRAMFERWLVWERDEFPGGCVIEGAAEELLDRPGPVRDYVVRAQHDWMDAIATAVRIAMSEGHFRPDLDPEQLAFELLTLFLGYHRHGRLFDREQAEARTRRAFEALVERARSAGSGRARTTP